MTELESWDEVPYLHGLTEDGSVIERVLPTGWEAPAKTLKALCQTKGVFKEARPQRGLGLRVGGSAAQAVAALWRVVSVVGRAPESVPHWEPTADFPRPAHSPGRCQCRV